MPSGHILTVPLWSKMSAHSYIFPWTPPTPPGYLLSSPCPMSTQASLMTATRLGREAHGSGICTFCRTESGREGKENKHIIQFLAKQFKIALWSCF